MKILSTAIFCAAAITLLAVSLRHGQDPNTTVQANHTGKTWLLPRRATAAPTRAAAPNQPLAPPTVSPNWTINSHGFCCEGNLAAQGQSTYVLLPVLDVGNKILRSDDGGQTWTQKYPLVNVSFPFGIEGDLNAFGNDTVYFGTEVADGVCAHSSDRGENWTVVQIPVAFPANDQAWAYLGPFANMRPGSPLPTDPPYVLAGWYRIGSVALFSFDGGLTWPIQTPLVGDDGSGPDHVVCQQMAHSPTSPGDTRIPDINFLKHKAGRHGAWGTDKKFYWTQTAGALGTPGNLYVCKTDNFGATWAGIVHPIAAGPDSGNVVTYTGFDNRGTLYVMHGDKLYVSFDQGESFAFVHTMPRYGNGEAADGANEFFVAGCGTIHIGLNEANGSGGYNIWYLRGSGVDTATPTWDEELVDVVGSARLDFMQIILNGNGIPTISYTDSAGAVTTASRNAPLPVVGPDPCAPVAVSAVSRKTHGSAGTFDINLPLTGTVGIECRSGQPTTGAHTIVVTFASPISAVASATCAGNSASTSISGNQVTVNCAGIPNAAAVAINLVGVNNGITVGNVSVPMGVLLGDVNADRQVDSSDLLKVKQQTLQPVGSPNFREDVNADGNIDSSDLIITKRQTLTGLP